MADATPIVLSSSWKEVFGSFVGFQLSNSIYGGMESPKQVEDVGSSLSI